MTSCFTAGNIWIRSQKRHSFHGPSAGIPTGRRRGNGDPAKALAPRAPRWHDEIQVNSFGHFILTRFNVPLRFDLPPERQPAPRGLDPDWLARRFDLFERICLASVARQTEPDFQWLVFLDEATPAAFRDRLTAHTATRPFLQPVYCGRFDEETVLPEIRRRETPGRLRITTRLDNDDAIHPRLIERVRRLAERQAPRQDLRRGFYLSFPLGCCARGGDFYLQRYRFNPFASYVSAPETDRTVLGTDHRYVADVAPVIFDWSRPMWCQTIHGENVANRLRGVYWPGGARSAFGPLFPPPTSRSLIWKTAEFLRSVHAYAFHR